MPCVTPWKVTKDDGGEATGPVSLRSVQWGGGSQGSEIFVWAPQGLGWKGTEQLLFLPQTILPLLDRSSLFSHKWISNLGQRNTFELWKNKILVMVGGWSTNTHLILFMWMDHVLLFISLNIQIVKIRPYYILTPEGFWTLVLPNSISSLYLCFYHLSFSLFFLKYRSIDVIDSKKK